MYCTHYYKARCLYDVVPYFSTYASCWAASRLARGDVAATTMAATGIASHGAAASPPSRRMDHLGRR
jgi:hypothetical protein